MAKQKTERLIQRRHVRLKLAVFFLFVSLIILSSSSIVTDRAALKTVTMLLCPFLFIALTALPALRGQTHLHSGRWASPANTQTNWRCKQQNLLRFWLAFDVAQDGAKVNTLRG